MKILKFNNKKDWLSARKGKITGSRLKNLIVKRGTGKKIGYYELIAERLAIFNPAYEEAYKNPMERGNILEKEAIARFEAETNKQVNTDMVIWVRDDNDDIALSPDGYMVNEAVEVKCLSSARHMEAYLTQEIPDEYIDQVYQYFIVNDVLDKLYFVFYDPRIPVKDFFVIEVSRIDVDNMVRYYLDYERNILQEVEQVVSQLTKVEVSLQSK